MFATQITNEPMSVCLPVCLPVLFMPQLPSQQKILKDRHL